MVAARASIGAPERPASCHRRHGGSTASPDLCAGRDAPGGRLAPANIPARARRELRGLATGFGGATGATSDCRPPPVIHAFRRALAAEASDLRVLHARRGRLHRGPGRQVRE